MYQLNDKESTRDYKKERKKAAKKRQAYE